MECKSESLELISGKLDSFYIKLTSLNNTSLYQ